MSDKKKRLAKALAKKWDMTYQSAMNTLNTLQQAVETGKTPPGWTPERLRQAYNDLSEIRANLIAAKES